MCTVTYLPINKNSRLITSSRDVSIKREASLPPEVYGVDGKKILFPKDPVGGGTWIAMSKDISVCLLNGAFKAHVPQSRYRHSRGLISLDLMKYSNIDAFTTQYDFDNIEPFTLVILYGRELWELRWDGSLIYDKKLDAHTPHLWASSPLYSDEIIAKRKYWFKQWLEEDKPFNTENIISFHKNYGEKDDENGLIINRNNGATTVSITAMYYGKDNGEMVYEDLIHKNNKRQLLYFDN
jgi:hypothetical protein